MNKKHRDIIVNNKPYTWTVKNNVDGDGSNLLKIWSQKKVIFEKLIPGNLEITPGYISAKIIYEFGDIMYDFITSPNKTPIVYVDMDDTLCEYKESFIKEYTKNPLNKYPQSIPGFYTGLKPISGAIEGIKFLEEHFDVYIATRPSYMNAHCYTEKRLWVEEHLGIKTCMNLTFAPNKNLLIGDYLIDDMPWDKFRGKQILFGSEEFLNWNSIVKYFKEKVLK